MVSGPRVSLRTGPVLKHGRIDETPSPNEVLLAKHKRVMLAHAAAALLREAADRARAIAHASRNRVIRFSRGGSRSKATRATRCRTITRVASFSKTGSTSTGGSGGGSDQPGEPPRPPALGLGGPPRRPGEIDGLKHASLHVGRFLARIGGAR